MKKLLNVSIVVFALAAILVTAGVVYAQTQFPPSPSGNGWGMGGMMDGYGFDEGDGPWDHMQDGFMMGGQYGPMHDSMVTAVAEQLSISTDELNAALIEGKTMWQVAEEFGFSAEETEQLIEEAHSEVLAQAVADGYLTAEQAEWMDTHMAGFGNFSGSGGCHR